MSKKTDGILSTPVDPVHKEHTDPDIIDLEAPRLAWYKQKTWKKHQNTVYWVCESGCAYHGIIDFVTNTLMKMQHVAVSENSVHNSCVPRTVIWTWRFILCRQT